MLKKIYTNKYIEWIISFIVLLPVSLSFILNPLSNDARVYNGLAKITDYFGSFPANVDLVWEVKPIGNRMLYYILYKITSVFETFGTFEYETLFKIFTVIIVLAICYYFSRKLDKKYIFLITSMAFLSASTFIAMQPDWWAALLAFLSLGLFLSEKPSNHYLAGAIITLIFLFKGSTIFLAPSIVCAVYLIKPDWFNRMKYGILGSVLSLGFILIWTAFKNVISDMLLSAKIARVGMMPITEMISHYVYNSLTIWFYIPAIVVGIYSAYLLYINYMMKDKNWKYGFVLIAMWISAAIVGFIQSEFFLFHYCSLIFPAIISIVLLSNRAIIYSITLIFIVFILCSSYWGIGMVVEREFYGDQHARVIEISEAVPDIMNQSTILYLDSGVAPYYFPANTSCRYTQPLPVQRNSEVWDTTDTYQYYEEYNCIMNYTGKYIIEDDNNWFHQNTSDMKKIWNKIDTEYEKVWGADWRIYRRISNG